LLRRLLVAAATLALVSALVFVVVDALADRAALDLGRGAGPEAIAARRALLGLDRPYLIRLLEHVGSAMSFQTGESGHEPVMARVGRALAPTLAYALPGFVLASLAALAGGFAAARRRGWLDRVLLALATALMSTSSVIVVVLGQHLLAHRLRLFPVLGWPLGGDPRAAFGFVLLPALLWALVQLGPDLRHYRALFIRELAAPHVEGLRARGLPEGRIARHLLRGALAPVLARVSARLPQLVLGSVVVEHLFNIPGVGALLLAALRDADLALVQGVAIGLAAATIGGQALCDLAIMATDPRARAAHDRGAWEGSYGPGARSRGALAHPRDDRELDETRRRAAPEER
jgi:peptide/nickel transport system permease protein